MGTKCFTWLRINDIGSNISSQRISLSIKPKKALSLEGNWTSWSATSIHNSPHPWTSEFGIWFIHKMGHPQYLQKSHENGAVPVPQFPGPHMFEAPLGASGLSRQCDKTLIWWSQLPTAPIRSRGRTFEPVRTLHLGTDAGKGPVGARTIHQSSRPSDGSRISVRGETPGGGLCNRETPFVYSGTTSGRSLKIK